MKNLGKIIMPGILVACLSGCSANMAEISGLNGKSIYNNQVEGFNGQETKYNRGIIENLNGQSTKIEKSDDLIYNKIKGLDGYKVK